MRLNYENNYSRKNNILFENGRPILKFTFSNFIDIDKLKPGAIDYMNKYIAMWPNHFELMKTNNDVIKFFYDLETTGTNHKKHSIHQISGYIEVNNEVVEEFNFKVQPNPKAQIEQEALTVCGVTEEQIRAYTPMDKVYKTIIALLSKYIDRYNPSEKMYLVGFNNRKFDDLFFHAWFEQNGDAYFFSWFYTESLDVQVLAGQYLIDRRKNMKAFKLKSVAKELGLIIDESRLHDAIYDVELTRDIYRIVTGLEIEL